jgi:hypothetical protein
LSFLTIGGAYSYRHTDTWSKDRWWPRVGFIAGPLWVIASAAVNSPNRERKLEFRLRLRHKWAVVEPRVWLAHHSTSDKLGNPSYGVDCLMGVTR